uniref:Ladinin n=1 Tax=Seriola lalandi dorsalis TaxID=1841481 RepID=A0A3B4WMQ6_SERLL
MSISRKNWSALSSAEQIQLDFVEMLRVRDEKRRMRHVETLRRQKEEEEDEAEASRGGGGVGVGGGDARVELLGDLDEEQGNMIPSVKTTSKPQPPSSVSISLDKSPSFSGRTTPMSPCSPTTPLSPREHWPSPCQSPSPRGAQSPVHNGHTQEMMRKKEEESAPLQRASVRMATKKFESNTQDQNEDEDKPSSFTRSRQRVSSRSIQEKMERLAQAAQKSEMTRSPDVTQRTLFLLEEVSRKRGLFEKEQQEAAPVSPGVSRQEFRSFASGMSDRINRWLNKDLRHVDITSKKSLFENRG